LSGRVGQVDLDQQRPPHRRLHVLAVTLPKTPEAQKNEKKIAIKKA
jgi:hypothetical protein